MAVVSQRGRGCCRSAVAVGPDEARRQSPHRKRFFSWVPTDETQLEQTERLVLRGLPYFQARIAGLNTIATDDIRHLDDDVMNSAGTATPLSPLTAPDDEREVLILIHGFAGGLAGWAQNWVYLAERHRVYAVDLPGFARSERRPTKASTLEESMDHFCDYLTRWFARLAFARPVIILAHSFGCFVISHFALRTGAAHIKMLILAEAWGLRRPDEARVKKYPLHFRVLLSVFHNMNPLAVLRVAGPAGPSLLRRARPDFEAKWSSFMTDTGAMYDYLYHCNAQPHPVGEKLFKACCHYDVCAKESLADALPGKLDPHISVGLLFGEDSWLNGPEGKELAAKLHADGTRMCFGTLPKAGHQIFTDNVKGFNKMVTLVIDRLSTEPSTDAAPAA